MKLSDFTSRLTDDNYRSYSLMLVVNLILGVVALGMSILNAFARVNLLLLSTVLYAVFSFLNAGMMLKTKRLCLVNYIIFEVSFVVLFTYFIITGGTEGFSPYWLLLLPACGNTLLGRKHGFRINLIMFLIVTLLLHSPLLNRFVIYEYGPAFRLRFPMVYAGFWAIGHTLEYIRAHTQRLLVDAQNELQRLSETDTLTGLHNRGWLRANLEQKETNRTVKTDSAMLLLDIDDFKRVNDTLGHKAGDNVLAGLADTLRKYFGDTAALCRWGGEEFMIYIPSCPREKLKGNAEKMCDAIRVMHADDEHGGTVSVTVSVGALFIPENSLFIHDKVFTQTDRLLYASKTTGKNRVTCGVYDADAVVPPLTQPAPAVSRKPGCDGAGA